MPWNLLPPQTPEDCRFRNRAEGDGVEGYASCGLVRAALPETDEQSCRVPRATCLACCQAAPATLTAWNPVVGSLIYRAACTLLNAPHARPAGSTQAEAARRRALACLDADGQEAAPSKTVSVGTLRDLIPPPSRRHPEPIRAWAVGVTTAPRGRPTLDVCLGNLRRAGWETPHLFMDSAVRVAECFGNLPGTLRSPAVGAWPNHYLALFELTMRHPEADAFLLMQDDALIYDGENVRAYLEQTLWPGKHLPIVSLFCPAPYTAKRHGWQPYRQSWVWGAQAFVFPRAILQTYLRDLRVCQHRWQTRAGGLTHIDVLIGRWARRRRIPLWFPTPSLVQHIGATSTLWPDCSLAGPRSASLFVGNQASGTTAKPASDPE